VVKKKRTRTERRADERQARKWVRERQKLAALEPGGARDRPIEVISSAVIPVRARSLPCPLCGGALALLEETARSATLRAAEVRCQRCGVARAIWFVIRPPLPN
jgi:predicted RNA-binding Zn-ribbon protein involved in translation (DUF1610 family)